LIGIVGKHWKVGDELSPNVRKTIPEIIKRIVLHVHVWQLNRLDIEEATKHHKKHKE